MDLKQVFKDIVYASEMNQHEIASILKCSQSAVSKIMRNEAFPEAVLLNRIVKLANKYKIKVKIEDLIPND